MAAEKDIISDIEAYFGKHGGDYAAWYVGITKNVDERLFGRHKVRSNGNAWIYRSAETDAVARPVEQHFLDLGMDGGAGGGDDDAVIVYAYKKSAGTDP